MEKNCSVILTYNHAPKVQAYKFFLNFFLKCATLELKKNKYKYDIMSSWFYTFYIFPLTQNSQNHSMFKKTKFLIKI
jgi:hypothetical protein